jgi:hypothetical protein
MSPYIKKEEREDFKTALSNIPRLRNSGRLNYVITEICKLYISDMKESYQSYNDIIGALEGAKLEMYRRKVSKYEDIKIKENGDVY